MSRGVDYPGDGRLVSMVDWTLSEGIHAVCDVVVQHDGYGFRGVFDEPVADIAYPPPSLWSGHDDMIRVGFLV